MDAMPMPLPMPNVQRPMTLVMPLADPSYAGMLNLGELGFGPTSGKLGPDLDDGGTVHFARFVIIGHNLVMASSYDGEFADYIQMFIHTMGDTFDNLMGFVANPAPTPVRDHPGEFDDWVKAHDIMPIGFYSGYEGATVQQIRAAMGMPSKARDVEPNITPLPEGQLDDVQGLILRGFGHPVARHVVLEVSDATCARELLAKMAEGGDEAWFPYVSHGAARKGPKPDLCCAVGLTATGLRALGVSDESLESFPTEFLAGAARRAPHVGDWNESSPMNWDEPLQDENSVHVVVSLYAADADGLDKATHALDNAAKGAFDITGTFDAAVFPDAPSKVHFGYHDNISQPIIAGDPVPRPKDHQPLASAGEFLLGYESQYGGVTLGIPSPPALGLNGSFTALRILEQDVVAFEEFIETAGKTTDLGTEKIAAKLVGRWRNGVPLVLSPDTDSPEPPIPESGWNNYNYMDTDPDGLQCPLSSHMRRANPRDQPMVPVGDGHARRIMRRGMPYGPQWKKGDPADDQPRGLIGHFIGASLLLQFETVMGEWLNRGMTNPTITGTNDVLLGVGVPLATCPIPTKRPDGNVDPKGIELSGFGQFTRTRGCVYAFLPSITALKWLATLD